MAIRLGKKRIYLGLYFDLIHSLEYFFFRFLKPGREGIPRKVAVFRADRLGDAFVCLPLFVEMNKHYELTVFSSSYNDFIFKKIGLRTIVYDNPAFYEEEESLSTFIHGVVTFNTLFPFKLLWKRFISKKQDYDLFILSDLSPVRQDFIVHADSSSRALSSPFLGYFLLPFLNVVFFHRYHMTDPEPSPIYQYYLGVRHFDPDFSFTPHANDLNFLAQNPEKDFNVPFEKFIVIHIGGKIPKRIYDKYMIDFLNHVDIPMVVIDDESKTAMNQLKPHIDNGNIFWVVNNYTLFEYLSLVLDKRCIGYIGYDAGHSHLLSRPKTSLTIFTRDNHEKWRTYTSRPYEKMIVQNDISLEYSPLDHTTKLVIYRDLECSPCYYRPCSDPICRAIPLLDCWGQMKNYFQRPPIVKDLTKLTYEK